MDKVIEAIETNIGLWIGKVHFYDKAINYLNDLIEEKSLRNILEIKKGLKKE